MLDKESLIFHCESLLDQRLFLQQMKLTRLQQLRAHDARLIDSLSALKRFLPIDEPSCYLAFIFSDENQWPHLLEGVTQETIPSDFLIYLAELAIGLEITSTEKLLSVLLSSNDQHIFDIGMGLATRTRHDIVSQVDIQSEPSIAVIKHWGCAGKAEYLDYLSDIIVSFSIDDKTKNTARLSRLFLGHVEDVISILTRLIDQNQIDSESIRIAFARMSEEECSIAISLLTNSDEVPTELVIYAMAVSGCTRYTPFLSEFFTDEKCRDSVLFGLATQGNDSLGEVIPYECFHPTRDAAWSSVNPSDLENDVVNWYHENSQSIVGRSIAGLALSNEALNSVWLTGNTLQRQQANLYLALRTVHVPVISPVALWGGARL